MEPPTIPNPDAARSAAAATASPDPVTNDLLVKHAAGQKLSASEYGRLGAFAKKVRNIFGSKGGAVPGQIQPPTLATGNGSAVAPLASGEASPGGLAPVPVDAELARRVTGAVLTRGEAVTVNWLERHAARAGATGATLERFRLAGRFQTDDRALIVELAPDCFQELGIDARKSPLLTVGAVLGLHVTNLWLVIDELKAMTAEREGKAQPVPIKQTSSNVAPVVAPVVTEPARPLNPS